MTPANRVLWHVVVAGAGWQAAAIEIRDAVAADARAACHVMKRSIAELFSADHENDSTILQRWFKNKTITFSLLWLIQPDNSLLVAVENGGLLAVSGVTDGGKIILKCVSPNARVRGISRAFLRALEARVVERGNTRCTPNSAETARRFYQANG